MKTKITISTVFISLCALAASFFSCGNPVALGSKLDIYGPVLNITAPSQRKSLPHKFAIEGDVSDFTGVDRIVIKAGTSEEEFKRQWRWSKDAWEVSENFGATWNPYEGYDDELPVWDGNEKAAEWKIPINMAIEGEPTSDGEYTFSVQSWDKAGNSDDNSYKAVILIIDLDPPKVDISTPYLYRDGYVSGTKKPAYELAPLDQYHAWDDTDDDWKDPAYLGRFLTQEFDLKWQIDDFNDIWSIDLRFYSFDEEIDDDPATPLPDETVIYQYHENLPPIPPVVNPGDFIKPNGSVRVPDLDSAPGTYNGGQIVNPVTEKTTIKLVAVCNDAAGNANQEKTIGYFIYWPRANDPWIQFTGDIRPPTGVNADGTPYNYYGKPVGAETSGSIDPEVFMVYPGRNIKATAYQAHGVKEVKYSLWSLPIAGNVLGTTETSPGDSYQDKTASNTPYPTGMYPTIFPWEFKVPPITGYYLIKVQAFSTQDKPSEPYTMLFRVQDITFPDFPEPPQPPASDPLFKAIGKRPDGTPGTPNTITITGLVSDATEIKSLCLVWINPESEGYAAMSQLSYFREKDYKGWLDILSPSISPGGPSITESYYDPNSPNRLWKLAPVEDHIDNETNRHVFTYSQVINLDDLNIGADKQPLRSQVFLFRAENPDGKTTIITYAPQGDTLAPKITISKAVITKAGAPTVTCIPGQYTVVEPFEGGETITIEGTGEEDSVKYLDINTYFKSNFEVTVNNIKLPPEDLTLTQNPGREDTGTWTITATVGDGSGQLPADKLKDTLVISVKAKDIGGNEAEIGSSWLIRTDQIRLMRISSEKEDGTYKSGDTVEIFLEFSKPVRLRYGGTPFLLLNTEGGAPAVAEYKSGQTAQNSRQYFVYTIGANHNTTSLNVTGLQNEPPLFTAANYPFTWYSGDRETAGQPGSRYEELRLTTTAGHDGNSIQSGGYFVRTLPVTANTADPDYQFTLAAGKHIQIDNAAPTVSGITSNTAAGYYNAGDIYMTVTFDKEVKITGTPALTLSVNNGASNGTTSTAADDVRVSGNKITFKYTIRKTSSGDTTNGAAVTVTTFSGTITDLVGNALAANAISDVYTGSKTLSNVIIETRLPSAPTVRVLTANNVNNVISQSVSGNTVTGESAAAVKNLTNVYNDNLWLAIQGNTTGDGTSQYKVDSLEYSINGGTSWVPFGNTANTPVQLTQSGTYNIIARQKDKAGNVSVQTSAVNFTWDPGPLISRISSESANGEYTHVTGRNEIKLTLNFRKALRIATTTTPQLTINAQRGGNNINVTIPTASIPGGDVNSLTFTYTVQNNDSRELPTYLDITALSGITAWDGNAVGNGVNVSSLIVLPAGTPKLDSTKQFTVATGNLTRNMIVFIEDNQGGTGWNTETNSNFHGIRTDDGSYWTTLEVPFNHAINKGSGNIIITQQSGTNYRLPAVMTESQYNRLKSNTNTSGVIDTYYVKGTNGYINGQGSDTSNKYVLNYQYDPNSSVTANNIGFTGNEFIPAGVFTNFRSAETITINVNASAVTIDGNTLKIRLTGSTAPQVPGATYTVTLPSGLVTDSMGNNSGAENVDVNLRGVAKPFVRIRKTQDTITTATAGNAQPRLVATQPFLSYARMDCRTPGSAITYTANEGRTTVSGNAPGTTGDNNNWRYNVSSPNTTNTNNNNAETNGKNNNNDPNATRPANATTTSYTNSNQITLGSNANGNTPDINDVQGYQWWVLARAVVGTTYSAETEEMAYRTVISYSIRGGNAPYNSTGAITANTGRSIFANGDQAWIRGGDAVSSSSIPGFPFTWEDNWNDLTNKRAGIRLMTLVTDNNMTVSLNHSTWRFVTWDMNATAYIDFIRGRDLTETDFAASSANEAWQYGPKRMAYQTDGWTSFKPFYPIYPGKHRWCDMGYQNGSATAGQPHNAMNFSGTLMARPNLTASYSRWPGINQP
ncbi:MAG: Ig-like domain-containing protein [Spirochaetaceae bacterium]|jgi:hypothetical protein|nr:Ig-like domain-containing protein [Spirochaetaceae bacterium]